MKLTPTQVKTLEKMEVGKWYNAATLKVSIMTLYALERRGLVKSKGFGYNPKIAIQWCKL